MIGDLHCHTRLSDGSMGLDDLLFYAKRSGLNFLSITDHDTMAGVTRATVVGQRLGIHIIPGVEISTIDPSTGRKVHILCYLPTKPDRLQVVLSKTLERRTQAGKEMIAKVKRFYPITEEHVMRYASSSQSIYTAHIMHALMDLGYDNCIYGSLYRQTFHNPNPNLNCLVPVTYPSVYEVLELVRACFGVSVMAHPLEYDSIPLLEELARKGLIDGAELNHPRSTPQARKEIAHIGEQYGLILTGGTDFHGFYSEAEWVNPLATCLTMGSEIDKIFKLQSSRL